MIKAEITNGEVSLGVDGDVQELLADTMLMIHAIHCIVAENSVMEGYLYELTIRKGLDLIFKPRKEDADMLKSVQEGYWEDKDETD